MKLTSEILKAKAKELGIDCIAIGNIERFQNTPPLMSPINYFPKAKSVIAIAMPIPRGANRGIEEGTMFSTYEFMGYSGMNWRYMPHVLRQIVCFIEDHGYEAVPLPNWDAFSYNGYTDYPGKEKKFRTS